MNDGTVSRALSADFNYGSISCRLTLEGEHIEGAEHFVGAGTMMERLSKTASKQIHKELIPIISTIVGQKGVNSDAGCTVDETVTLSLLDYTFTIDLELKLDGKELKFPGEKELGFMLVQTVASAIVAESNQRLPKQLYIDAWQQFLEDNPDECADIEEISLVSGLMGDIRSGHIVVGVG